MIGKTDVDVAHDRLVRAYESADAKERMRLFRKAMHELRLQRNSEIDRWLPRLIEAFGSGVILGPILLVVAMGVLSC